MKEAVQSGSSFLLLPIGLGLNSPSIAPVLVLPVFPRYRTVGRSMSICHAFWEVFFLLFSLFFLFLLFSILLDYFPLYFFSSPDGVVCVWVGYMGCKCRISSNDTSAVVKGLGL